MSRPALLTTYSPIFGERGYSEIRNQDPAWIDAHVACGAVRLTRDVVVPDKDPLRGMGTGEGYPEEEILFRDLWEDETQRDVVIDCLKADCKVRTGRPPAGL